MKETEFEKWKRLNYRDDRKREEENYDSWLFIEDTSIKRLVRKNRNRQVEVKGENYNIANEVRRQTAIMTKIKPGMRQYCLKNLTGSLKIFYLFTFATHRKRKYKILLHQIGKFSGSFQLETPQSLRKQEFKYQKVIENKSQLESERSREREVR
ncbi:hypothetical protein RUM44_002323 [Polyplax serrata]|uniref:NUMOD4 domain-containing protein n=1 Tax=Polyplax serrata TaxID=468196 RepID=A0ABR1AMJ7_POLSC